MIYGGKDAKIKIGTYELPYVYKVTINDGTKTIAYRDVHNNLKTFNSKPIISGVITLHDVGIISLAHFLRYKTVVTSKLSGQFSDDTYTIGFHDYTEADTPLEVYNGQDREIELTIPSDAIADTMTFKDIHLYVTGEGTPNSATYTAQLREGGSTVRDSDTWTWTTNDARWVTLTMDYETSVSGTWDLFITTTDVGTTTANCQSIYSISGITYPNFTSTVYPILLEIEDWLQTEQKIDMTVTLSTTEEISLTGVTFGDIGKTYTAAAINTVDIPFIAETIEWNEI